MHVGFSSALGKSVWLIISARKPPTSICSLPGRCTQENGIPNQHGGGSHNFSPAGSSLNPSLCPIYCVYTELCKLIPEIPGASVRWFL